jgi:hypothetical protein
MPAAAFAQDTGRITGRVVAAQTQRPVVSAQVFVEGLRLGALADAQGRFTIPNVPAGAHNVRVETIGFAASTKSVTVAAGETATVDFSLEETAVALEELVVTGTAVEVRSREIGNSLDAVTSRELENVPVTNPENIIGGRIPGVTVIQGSGQPACAARARRRRRRSRSSTSTACGRTTFRSRWAAHRVSAFRRCRTSWRATSSASK